MATALDIIKHALIKLDSMAINETPSSEDANHAFTILNWMLKQWNNKSKFIYQITNGTYVTVADTASYLIGSGQTWNTTRPIRITEAFVRNDSTDYPLTVIQNDEYQRIAYKSTPTGIPTHLMNNNAYPYATIYLWPVPDAVYTIGLSQWTQFTQFSGLTTAVSLPDGYELALVDNLAFKLAPSYGKPQIDYRHDAEESASILSETNDKTEDVHFDNILLGRSGYFNINTGDIE